MMKDILGKLTEIEASAPKPKAMLTEDASLSHESNPRSFKEVFESIAGMKPIPVVGKEGGTQQTGAGFVNVTDPALQSLGKTIGDLAAQKKLQIVVPTTGQPTAPTAPKPAGTTTQPTVGGQGQAMGAGQQQVQEKWGEETKVAPSEKGKYAGKTKAELTSQYNKLKASGPHKKGSPEFGKMRELSFAIRAKSDWGKVQEEQLDEKLTKSMSAGDVISDFEKSKDPKFKGKSEAERKKMALGAYYGMHPEKSKKKTNEGDIPSSAGVDTRGAGLGAGRSMTTLEGIDPAVKEKEVNKIIKKLERIGASSVHKPDALRRVAEFIFEKMVQGMSYNQALVLSHRISEGKKGVNPFAKKDDKAPTKTPAKGKKPDFLDLDKDGDKKESMKKAAADKKKKVDESMNHKISAARFEGKSHGLRGHAHRGKAYDDLEEMRAYHEGFKEGMDELYEMGMYETAPAATVPGMADEEMLGELSPATYGSYVGKASASMNDLGQDEAYYREPGRFGGDAAIRAADKLRGKAERRHQGINTAVGKLTQPAMADEEMLGELSPATLGSYVGKGSASMHDLASDEAYYREPGRFGGDAAIRAADKLRGKAERRHQGINTAVGKLTQPAMEDEFDEGNAFTAALARTPKGGKFSVGGKTFTDKSSIEEYAFESWDNQLKALINEGLSVSISKGQQNTPDSVTITAQDAEADELLAFVKQAGLGLFGGSSESEAHPSSAMSVQPSHGAAGEVGAGGTGIEVVDGHDGMLSLMNRLGGISDSGQDDEDYADEESSCDCEAGNCNCDDETNEEACMECGSMMEAGHSCGSKEMVDEVESEDQQEFEVAEDNAPDSGATDSVADENAEAAEDSALAKSDSKGGTYTVNEEDDEEEEEEVAEGFTFESIYKKFDMISSNPKELETVDFRHKEKVDEWANQVGKGPGKGTDAQFTQDIDFMTKVISGGLNKPKSTGQTTVPVIAGQEDRIHDEITNTPANFAKLAGLKK